MLESGTWIKSQRETLRIKPSDVERITRNIAEKKDNSDFYVSHSTLADIESESVPSIHKLFSLAFCLKLSLNELLMAFGVDSEEISPTQAESHGDAFLVACITSGVVNGATA